MAGRSTPKTVETLNHEGDKRRNIPTEEKPRQLRYLRNLDIASQLVWRGKDEQDWGDLVVNAPALYIQEKVHPKALIDDFLRMWVRFEFEIEVRA